MHAVCKQLECGAPEWAPWTGKIQGTIGRHRTAHCAAGAPARVQTPIGHRPFGFASVVSSGRGDTRRPPCAHQTTEYITKIIRKS